MSRYTAALVEEGKGRRGWRRTRPGREESRRERDTYPLIFGPLYSSYSML